MSWGRGAPAPEQVLWTRPPVCTTAVVPHRGLPHGEPPRSPLEIEPVGYITNTTAAAGARSPETRLRSPRSVRFPPGDDFVTVVGAEHTQRPPGVQIRTEGRCYWWRRWVGARLLTLGPRPCHQSRTLPGVCVSATAS